VTMAEVAAELDVSERTLFRYFPTKESLLDPAHEELVARLVEELAARPPGESAFVAVRESLRAISDELDDDREALAGRHEIIHTSPSLQAHFLQRQSEIEVAIAEVVAKRAGIDTPDDLRPALVAAMAVGALRVAIEHWITTDTGDDLLTSLEHSLDLLAHGLAEL
jgi:AcrR family transcriptional regulator